MKRGRKPIDVSCPKGYPFRLYEANGEYVIGTSILDMRKKLKSKEVKPVNVGDLISANGHEKTNTILKQLGESWVCREGYVFYRA